MLTATVTDSATVTGVVFRIDGGNVGTLMPATPYQYEWDTAPWWNGAHTVTAVALDAAGNVALAPNVVVTSSN
jgi:hypothetical protein